MAGALGRTRRTNRLVAVLGGCLAVLLASMLLPVPASAAIGDLDTTFSADGKVTTDLGADEAAHGVAMQRDGKIVVVGETRDDEVEASFALARYNPDGTLDASFDGDGKVTADFGGSSDSATSVAIQPDGKIVASGYVIYGDAFVDFALARFNADGSLDATFDGDGKFTTEVECGPGLQCSQDDIASVMLQADGKIVAAGSSDSDVALARYNTNGSLDASFDGDGKVTTDFSGGDDSAEAAAIQADGRIVVVGTAGSGTNYFSGDLALARYNTNGSLDASFDGDGKVTTDFSGVGDASVVDVANAVAIHADGRIVIAGEVIPFASPHPPLDFVLARYNANGSLDASFDGDGKVTTDFSGRDDFAEAVAVQPDGNIVAAGGAGPDFALARYRPNGSPDDSFDGDGQVTTDFSGGGDVISAVAIQADAKIVAAGAAGSDFALARYQAKAPPPAVTDWQSLGGYVTSDPAVVSRGPDNLDVFVRGGDNALWHQAWNGSYWSQWQSLGGYVTSDPAVVSRGAGSLDVFVRGGDNALWQRSWNGSAWSQWQSLGGFVTSNPTAVSWSTDRVDVFVRGGDNALWHQAGNGSAWFGWQSRGGYVTSDPTAVARGVNRLDMFVRGGDNALWHQAWTGSSWSQWQSRGGFVTSNPAAVAPRFDRHDVFVRGGDSALWHRRPPQITQSPE
ncbi:MAG TPA: hypothetical protein VK988_21830 [Acidimicrobiales bacterium]|nr:hypothetical protein [Acidimicrobiales bacterium]